jgi:formyltetrahydrofolate-dependent phosphoribosylglycinamide formyltransferase
MNAAPDAAAQSALGRPARLLVLLSGSGRTLENLITRIDLGELPAEIAGVIASRPCRGVEIAEKHAVPARVVPGNIAPDALDALVRAHDADWIVLAGYLRLVPITPTTRGRIVNIHPALLPNFGGPGMHGMHVHAAVLEAFARGEVTESGCTVHLVDETYDTGPVILQKRCPVKPTDDPEDLADRVFSLELDAYPEALRRLIESDHRPQ